MCLWKPRLVPVLVFLIWACPSSTTQADPFPLQVDRGRATFVLKTTSPDDHYYLVVGSLGSASQTCRVVVRADISPGPESLPLEPAKRDPAWTKRVSDLANLMEKARRQRPALDQFSRLAAPPAVKTFHLFTGARDLENPRQYQALTADLHGTGKHCQVYVDRGDKFLPGLGATVAEIIRVFDDEVQPWASRRLGRVVDVDRDGRFTILLSRWLDKLQNGTVHIDGFVRGSDFLLDMAPPFSNRCDMLYLNANLKPGPHLRTILAHEFTHAVAFCEHALGKYAAGQRFQDEESWLSEGLAHLVENLHGFSRTNLEDRIAAFLACPERYPLVLPDYFAAGQWRDPGTRGAAFLFMKSCYDLAGPDLPRRLTQSNLQGIANLEAATQIPFPELFRHAALTLIEQKDHGLHFHDLPLHKGQAEANIAGTAAGYFLLHSPAGSHARITIESEPPVALQVTLVPAPHQMPVRQVSNVPQNPRNPERR